MNPSIIDFPWYRLIPIFIPVLFVAYLFYRWSLPTRTVLYASLRMLLQLMAVGYALLFIFELSHPLGILLVLTVMVLFASWIALRPVPHLRKSHFGYALGAILIGGLPILIFVMTGLIRLSPWYTPRYLIPIAGMIFAQCMNSISLAADRYHSDREKGMDFIRARNAAFQTAILPMTNAFFAVGLVSLPGMMTGQILAGVDPLIAIRYQIMVMCMLFGSVGISSAVYLTRLKTHKI